MRALTPRQRDLLAFIQSFVNREGIAPNFDQMAAAVGLKSKSGISGLLRQLEERGAISRRPRSARAIEILDDDRRFAEGVELRIADYCRVHRVGREAAVTRAVEHFFGGRA